MPNNFFQFKEFIVCQNKTAMKVCTDACLFAAWVTRKVLAERVGIDSILDIGSGTGLLSLMLAQKIEAKIEAVEIDEQAAIQSKENFEVSPWSARMFIHHTSIQCFSTPNTYDLIISNPPFYKQSLLSYDKEKNVAKHSVTLQLETLADVVIELLKAEGKFAILLPQFEFSLFEELAKEKQLQLLHKADVQQTPSHSFFRTMGIFSKETIVETQKETVTIKNNENNYTPYFTELLKDYYLHLQP
jgi:tRNA1Val (adenine37-N6)-methyltransferase